MKINRSGATFSSIVGIGASLKKLSDETGQEYLFLNRGVNAVCTIDLSEVVSIIDFNSTRIQVYPPNKGFPELRQAINEEYFAGKGDAENIFITAGGMQSLDLIVQTLQLDKLYYAKYFWGSYSKMAKIRGVESASYFSLVSLIEALKAEGSTDRNIAVLICDPNNPVGDKMDDGKLLEAICELNALGVTVIFDSPYRKLFVGKGDTFHQELLQLENVIIAESFSKSFGLSGQRVGFVHSTNKEFCDEFNIRILYTANGVNAFAQELVCKLLTTSFGRKAADNFKRKTVRDITRNIRFLEEHGLLAEHLYRESKPIGIFVVVNKSQEELLQHRIGSVSMAYFTHDKNEEAKSTSRICVSVPHEKFKEFFSAVVQKPEVMLKVA